MILSGIDFQTEHLRPARYLVVAFTGVSHGLGGVDFDFYQTLGAGDAAALFVRDRGQRWYQYEENQLLAVDSHIREAAAKVGAERLLLMGNSMGGFGALLFGKRLAANAILAFAPQTCITPALTAAMGDYRWGEYQAFIPSYPVGDLNSLQNPDSRVTVCASSDDPLDIAHADRLSWPHSKERRAAGGHAIAKTLRDAGELEAVVRAALG